MNKKLWLFLAILAIPLMVQAAQITLTASVDKTEATTEDTILLTVAVAGTQSAPRPAVPAPNGIEVKYSGKSSEVSIVNGAVSSHIKYNYLVLPQKEGNFTIGPAYIDIDGRRVKSNPVRLIILSAQAQPTEDKPLFLSAQVSNAAPYYNEQIVYTIQFGRRLEVLSATLDPPQFQDFWLENLGEQKQYHRVIEGQNYLITEIKKALFPTKTGKIIIEPTAINCEVILPSKRPRSRSGGHFFNNFFSVFERRSKMKILHSESIELNVKPLPEKGKPKKFSPLVGQLKLKASSSKNSLEAGDSTTVTVDLIGDVNIRDAQLENPPGIEDFKIYDDKPTINITQREDVIIGQKTFKKAFVPQKPGQLKIPGFAVPYFDPKTAVYKLARSRPINLQVSPAAEKEKLHEVGGRPKTADQKEAIKILGRDILPIFTDTEALKDARINRRDYMVYILLFMLPGLAFLTVFSLNMRREKHKKDAGLLRKKNAYKKALKNLEGTSSILKNGHQANFYAEISKTIKGYLGDKLGLPGIALTPQEVEDRLNTAGFNGDLIKQIKELMEQCDACQFGSLSTGHTECQLVYKNTKQMLKQLEKILRSAG